MKRLVPLLLLGLVAGAFLLGGTLRREAGIEMSTASIQGFVDELGLMGPALYVLLVVFRNFLVLPSFLLLATAGLLFGVGLGTLVGGAGIFVSGCLKCGIVRLAGREYVRPQLSEFAAGRLARAEERLNTAGLLFVGLNTGHPVGILSPLHWAYGLTSLPFWSFVAMLAVAAPLRAFFCSYFGASLLDIGSRDFFTASAILALALLLPLAHPGVRQWLRERRRRGWPASSYR